jgi:hypothetical protein
MDTGCAPFPESQYKWLLKNLDEKNFDVVLIIQQISNEEEIYA